MGNHSILVIVPFPLEEEGLNRRDQQADPEIFGDNVNIEYKPVRSSCAYVDSYHDKSLLDLAALEAGMDAEREGYDAVCIDTVSDSGMKALRSVLSIPVVGPNQVQFHIAQILGKKFSILTQWDRWISGAEDHAIEYNATDKLVSIRSINMPPDLDTLLSGKEDEVFPRLREEGMKAIEEDGADVICMGSTTMHQAVSFLDEELPVPILNPGPLSYKIAELLLDLGLTHSKKAYPEPNVPMDDKIHHMFDQVEDQFEEFNS